MTDARAGLVAALEASLPAGTSLHVWSGEGVPDLFPVEVAAVSRAVPARRVEFARGRGSARAALSALGAPAGPIRVGDGRQPVWPDGYVGSITHCEGFVAAAAASTARVAALGLDAEAARPLPDEVRARVLHDTERAVGARRAHEARGGHDAPTVLETIVFSAKESIHKALFPLSGVWLDFLDVVVRLDPERGTFEVGEAPSAVARVERLPLLRGGFRSGAGYVVTWCYLESEAPTSMPT